MAQTAIDIVIPLGSGSKYCNFELRMALRSIQKYALHVRHVYLVGSDIPDWVCNVKVINCPDRHCHNKDANLIDKLLAAVNSADLSGRFIFWSDDQLALRRFSASALRPVYNHRGAASFKSQRTWHRRMQNTFEYLKKCGIYIEYNWDSHLPQIMDKLLFGKLMSQLDYRKDPGFCVNTLYFGLSRTAPMLEQSRMKITVEKNVFLDSLAQDKIFLGYNDAALQGNLPGLLLERFPQACKFERATLPEKSCIT